MDLWIRSQDRKALRINPELEIYEDNNKDILVMDTKGSTDYYVAKVLGKYKTTERALEVLDEIQAILRGKYATSFDYKVSLNGFKKEEVEHMLEQMAVYEMPLE